jgi:glutaredoxin
MASDLIPRRPVTCSFYRRRRILLIPALLFAFCMFFSSPWSLPPLNLSGISSSISRANIVSLVKGPPVEEIYGLLHFVTSDDDRMLSHSVNPAAPIDLNEYLGGDKPDWKSHMRRLKEEYPLIVFSKSYCPFSKKTKKLLESYNLSPPPKIIEVDLRDDWDFMKLILTRLTDHSTYPNIILNGQGLGGNDDLHTLRAQGKLKKMFENAGMTVREDTMKEQETQ